MGITYAQVQQLQGSQRHGCVVHRNGQLGLADLADLVGQFFSADFQSGVAGVADAHIFGEVVGTDGYQVDTVKSGNLFDVVDAPRVLHHHR